MHVHTYIKIHTYLSSQYMYVAMYICSETPAVVIKKNLSKKQYGLSRLPVNRKQAYLQTTAAQQDHSDKNEQFEVEYDSDNDEDDNDNKNKEADKTHFTNTVNTKTVKTNENNDVDDDKINNLPEESKTHPKDQKLSLDKQSVDSGNVCNSVTEDVTDKHIVPPKKTKLIGPSLGPLKKRRRRSSEVCKQLLYINTYIRTCIHTCIRTHHSLENFCLTLFRCKKFSWIAIHMKII